MFGVGGLTYANNRLGANQLDVLVLDRALGVTLGIGGDVAKVTNVAGLIGGSTVGLVVGVDWKTGKLACEESMWEGAHYIYIYAWRLKTYSEGRQRCSRWCCRQRCGCACHAGHQHRGQ